MKPSLPFLFCAVIAGCASGPTTPPEPGKGLLAADPTPPEGAELFERPEWRVGDEMVFVRGGAKQVKLTVEAADEEGYTIVDEVSGIRLRRDRDLADLYETPAGADEPVHRLMPRDMRFHWPLWVGKRWRSSVVDWFMGTNGWPLEVSYHCEGIDTIEVPAGTFRCLRIVRRAAVVASEGQKYFERHHIVWYAPDIGVEVRRLSEDRFNELAEWRRADSQ